MRSSATSICHSGRRQTTTTAAGVLAAICSPRASSAWRRPPAGKGVTAADVIDFTPELRAEALAILTQYDHGPLFTPPSERGAVLVPGIGGGASWAGAAFDPDTGRLYVTSVTSPNVVRLSAPPAGSPIRDRYVGRPQRLTGPQGLPLLKPPFGRLTAIDLHTGEHAWVVPVGEGPRRHPLLEPLQLGRLGWNRRSFPLVTRTLLFVAQAGSAGPPPAAPGPPRVLRPRARRGDPRALVFAKGRCRANPKNTPPGE